MSICAVAMDNECKLARSLKAVDCDCIYLPRMNFVLTSHLESGSNTLRTASCFAGETPYPAFLSKHWFQHQNASALRKHIRNLILQLFREQKRLPDDHQTVLHAVADMADYQDDKGEPKYALGFSMFTSCLGSCASSTVIMAFLRCNEALVHFSLVSNSA